MNPAFYIALRFTAARKRALLLSLSGVVAGVAFFISTQAQTQGFEKFFIQTILGTSGAITIGDRYQARYSDALVDKDAGGMVAVSGQQPRKYYPGIDNPDLLMRVVREYSGVLSVAPVVEGNVTVRTDFKNEVMKINGIDLREHLRTTSLGGQILAGSIEGFRDKPFGIMVGSLLADKLGIYNAGDNRAQIGSLLYLTSPSGDTQVFTLQGVFQSGINVIDESRAYVHIQAAQSLLRMPFAVTGVVVRLREPDRAPQIAAQLDQQLRHRSRSWQERESGNLAIFRALRLSAGITVSLIILLAGFGIFNIMTMTVLNKIREIAILRSMGYRRADIQNIFLLQGLIIATIGSVAGCALGALFTLGISHIPLHIRGIIHTDTFVVAWSLHHYVVAVVIAFISVLTFSYFPARRAASLPPVDTLRGSGQ